MTPEATEINFKECYRCKQNRGMPNANCSELGTGRILSTFYICPVCQTDIGMIREKVEANKDEIIEQGRKFFEKHEQ